MTYKLPSQNNVKKNSILEPYFDRVRGKIIPGAHRLQILLQDWIEEGIFHIPSVLVTGSNGKGTTCAFIESILRHHDLKTGLYTSPHLIHPNERIRINGIPISENNLENNLNTIIDITKVRLPDASLFEILTATALLTFLKEKIDFLICEVGLGGLYDSTNSISPLVSILTSVSLEHTDFLGKTLKKISSDKSFVSRRNKPFIVNHISEEALEGLMETVQITGANIIHTKDKLPQIFENQITQILNSKNNFNFAKLNIINLRTALHAVESIKNEIKQELNKNFEVDPKILEKSILNTEWPGRFDIRKIKERTVIFDASHNPEGFQYFVNEYFQSPFSKVKCVLIFASLSDKDWKKTLSLIPEIADSVIFTEISSQRSEISENISNYFNMFKSKYDSVSCSSIKNLDLALESAMNQKHDLPIVITGSIAFIGAAMERFGISFHRGTE